MKFGWAQATFATPLGLKFSRTCHRSQRVTSELPYYRFISTGMESASVVYKIISPFEIYRYAARAMC